MLSESEESEQEEVVEEVAEEVEVQGPTQSDIIKANQHQMNDVASDVSDVEISSENEDEQASSLYHSVQQIDPMKLWRPKFGLTSPKNRYEMNREESQLTLPKPTFLIKGLLSEKDEVKAELAMPIKQHTRQGKWESLCRKERLKEKNVLDEHDENMF